MITYSIIQKSQLEGAPRIDAEYYQPEYLLAKSLLISKSAKVLGSYAFVTDGEHGSVDFMEEGIKYLTAENINEGFINVENIRYVSEEVDKRNKRASLKMHDITLSIKGTVGLAALVFGDELPANMNRDVARIHVNAEIDPFFLTIFLNSRFGRNQTLRESSGNVQQMITLSRIRQLLVPKIDIKKSENIKDLYINSYQRLKDGKKYYSEAENLLLEELGLSSFAKASEDEKDLSWIVNLSDVKRAKRVDAEYFQPKYEKLVEKLKSQNAGRLEQVVGNYSTGFPFKSDNYVEQGIPLIRINNIRKGFIDLNDTAYLSKKDHLLSPKDTARSGDIVLSMSGTIGMTAVIPEDVPTCSINQRILKFTPKNIDRDYLALVINTIVGLYQLERIGTGGVQTNISYKDIKNILIPVLPKPTQQKIAELVRKSHEARKKSKQLLEQAKRKVETSIETQSKRND